jgi:cysteine desulfurase/selenocysteine lyase
MSTLDIAKIRADFPILQLEVNGRPLVYLDNAASTQKPQVVIETLREYYLGENANIHRGVHYLSELATRKYEAARHAVAQFLNAASDKEIIWTRGATEGINLVASTFGRRNIGAGDEIVLSAMEHHSNIVPWQMLAEEKGAVIRVAPINDAGELLLDELEKLLNAKTKIVAMAQMSNTLGTINPAAEIIRMAHARGIPVLLDAAQSVPHAPVDVQQLDADFLVFSGHKIYGPTGIGVLYAKQKHLEAMPPYQGGGDMISNVTWGKTLYNELPYKFEAGTPHIAGAIGLGAAIDYVSAIGLHGIAAQEADLLAYATEQVGQIEGIRLIGTARCKASVLSFVHEAVDSYDLGMALDEQGVAIRTGHHCTQPLMDRLSLPSTARASFAFYNTRGEVDALAAAIRKAARVFG